jgi:hypothetical protein
MTGLCSRSRMKHHCHRCCSSSFLPAVRLSLYWDSRAARADDAKVQPWRKWGKSLSITYCGGLLLLQGVLIVQSLGVAMPLDLSAIGRTLGVLLAIMCLLTINQMPKLPWFERRFAPGGNLGPIYGPRYMRTQSRVLVVFMIAVIAYSLAAPPTMGWRSAPYILLAAALLVVSKTCYTAASWKNRLLRTLLWSETAGMPLRPQWKAALHHTSRRAAPRLEKYSTLASSSTKGCQPIVSFELVGTTTQASHAKFNRTSAAHRPQ